MEDVLAANPKVMIDVRDGSQSMLYLPLDQILKERQRSVVPQERGSGSAGASAPAAASGVASGSGNSRSSTGRESRR